MQNIKLQVFISSFVLSYFPTQTAAPSQKSKTHKDTSMPYTRENSDLAGNQRELSSPRMG